MSPPGSRPDHLERARLFVALDLPAPARELLERWRAPSVNRVTGLRAVAAEALHVTLCFLGSREASEIPQIGAACAAAADQLTAPRLAFADALWLPRGRPRVLAVELDDPSGTLGDLQAAVSTALSEGGWYTPETRPYLGHVTVARLARGARVSRSELAPLPAQPFVASPLTLYRSRLGRSSARYEALRTIALQDTA